MKIIELAEKFTKEEVFSDEPQFQFHLRVGIIEFAKKIDEEYELVEKEEKKTLEIYKRFGIECCTKCCMGLGVIKVPSDTRHLHCGLDGKCVCHGQPEVEKKECTVHYNEQHCDIKPRQCEHGKIYSTTLCEWCSKCGGIKPMEGESNQPPVLPELPGELLISKENSFYNIVEPINQIIRYLTALRASKECNTKE